MPETTTTKTPKKGPLPVKANTVLDIKSKHPDLTTREIGELADCDHSHVVRVLAKYGLQQANAEDYKKNRADIFAGMQGKILNTVTQTDIKKATLLQKTTAMGILYDKERLERGETTQNIATVHADIAEIRKLQEGKK